MGREGSSLQKVQAVASARKYECIFLVRSDLSQDQVRSIIAEIEEFVKDQGGTVFIRDGYLLTQLPRLVKKQKRGIYVVLNIECLPQVAQALDQRMRRVSFILSIMVSGVEEFEETPTPIGRGRSGYSRYGRSDEEGVDAVGSGSSERRPSYGRRSYGEDASRVREGSEAPTSLVGQAGEENETR